MDRRFRLQERLQSYDLGRPESKRRYNRKLFAAVSGRYGAARRVLSFGLDSAWKRRLLRLLPAGGSPRILDLACGTGELTAALARRYPRGRIVGMDLSGPMLRRARRYLRGESVNLRFLSGDMSRIPFPDRSFDAVSGGYALRNAPDLEQTLREIHRVLAPGGRAVFLEFSASPYPRLRELQLRLLGWWGSLWGLLLHRNPEVYRYIAESLRRFPDRRELEAMLRRRGFHLVRSRSLFFSLLRLTLCRKDA